MRAAIYTRISNDRTGAGLGVERQRDECTQLTDRLGYNVVATLEDNDISAYSGKPRPGYARLLQMIAADLIDVVIVWHTDRLHRSLTELEEFIRLCEDHAVTVRTVQSGELDLSSPTGQMTARIVGAVARHEIDHARRRMLNAHKQAAANGKAHGKIPFGYAAEYDDAGNIVRRVPHPTEAPLIREAAERVLAGETLYAVRMDWAERGITTRSGRPWSAQTFREMLMRPTAAGLRVHQGRTVTGEWEPIITPTDHTMLVSLISDASRRTHRGTGPRYLLSGIAECGGCGRPMWRLKNRDGSSSYSCTTNRCTSRRLDPVDALVSEAILRRCESLSVSDYDDTSEDVAEALAEARELRARLDGFVAKAAAGELTPETLSSVESALMPKIRAAELRALSTPSPAMGELLGENARAHWSVMSLPRRRAVIRGLARVTILPVGKGRRFDPESIRLEWL